MRTPLALAALTTLLLTACNIPLAPPTPTETPPPTATATHTETPIPTSTVTSSPTITLTPTITDTPLPTATFTPTETSTPEPPMATATMNAFCRWGPGTAYRSIGEDFLEEGERALVEGRDYDTTWFWVKLEGLKYHCWVSASVVTINFEPKSVPYVPVNVPVNNRVPSPKGVTAVRNGNQVTISWQPIPPAPEVEYLIEATLCFHGYLQDVAYSTTNTSITLQDDQNCDQKSSARLYGANKLGYSKPVTVPWP